MKKFITAIIALTMLTAAISGCTDNGNSSDSSGSTNVSDSSDNSNSSNSTDDSDNSDNSDTSGTADNSGNTSDNASGGTSETEFDLPDPNGRAAKMGAAAMAADEWPSMMDVVDPELASAFFGIDLSKCEDYYLSNQLISAQLNEVIIVKPAAGSEDEIKAAVDAHAEYIKNEGAFYPDQEASAAGTVTGTTEDGYLYIIVHANGADIAAAMLAAE
ncbi:MAG: DUF4358 domain-containing protein [Oscillospiraceae bacterium]|nr:DUF4358 domain-containing protein [Oscillospiraceae bacterium]